MSTRSSAKSSAVEYWRMCWEKYQRIYPGPFRPKKFAEWCVKEGLADLPSVNPMDVLVKKVKAALRAARVTDSQGRVVREMLPARIPLEVDENGNLLLFEVRYDHIHKMSADHALLVFEQKDENINRQRGSATRELESFKDNNPNAKGREHQFKFDFEKESREEQPVQTISETARRPNKPR